MKKEEVVNQKEVKGTNKWVVLLILVFTTIFTVLPIVAMICFIFLFDEGIYTEFKENKYGEIMVKDDARIYGVESYYDEASNNYYIQGYLENLDDEEIEYISIEYSVYDRNNVLLGTAYAGVDYLGANSKWKFKAIYSDIDSNEVVRYELSSVELY